MRVSLSSLPSTTQISYHQLLHWGCLHSNPMLRPPWLLQRDGGERKFQSVGSLGFPVLCWYQLGKSSSAGPQAPSSLDSSLSCVLMGFAPCPGPSFIPELPAQCSCFCLLQGNTVRHFFPNHTPSWPPGFHTPLRPPVRPSCHSLCWFLVID